MSSDFSLRSRVLSGVRLVAFATVVSLAPALADDQPSAKDKPSNNSRGSSDEKSSSIDGIPRSLKDLKLTDEQRTQIKEIAREYDESINSVWLQYRDRYMQTVMLETSLLSAIEDQLSDEQRQQVRDQRHKTARHKKHNASEATGSNKPKSSDQTEVEIAIVGITLTPEQDAAAEKVHQKYGHHLRSANREIHGLHSRLISLEMDKITEIEKVLTKEQISQLRQQRQNAPENSKVTHNNSDAAHPTK